MEYDARKFTQSDICYRQFRFGGRVEWVQIFVGTVASMASGGAFPLSLHFLGNLISSISKLLLSSSCRPDQSMCWSFGKNLSEM